MNYEVILITSFDYESKFYRQWLSSEHPLTHFLYSADDTVGEWTFWTQPQTTYFVYFFLS